MASGGVCPVAYRLDRCGVRDGGRRRSSPKGCITRQGETHELEHVEGDVVFRHACKMGLERIVSKRLGSRYRSGRFARLAQV